MRRYTSVVRGAVVAAAMIGFAGIGQASELKIGYVDVKSAVENTTAYQEGLKKLEALKNKKQKELDALSAQIDQAGKEILGQSMAMSPDRLAAKQQSLNEMRKNYNRTQQDAQEELVSEKNRLDMSVGAKLQTVLQEFGKEGGYDMILPRPVMLYANPKFDVTAEITKRLDKK